MATPSVVHRDPNIQGGVPVFRGTPVPLRSLIDYLERGEDLEDFLSDFPSVTREQAIAALEEAEHALTARGKCPPRRVPPSATRTPFDGLPGARVFGRGK
jgi:uncharacterized protein (DUF433 family)